MNICDVVNCIDRVNKKFVRGTWNFNHERNLQCLLFGYLRESSNKPRVKIKKDGKIKTVELVHAEFNSPSTHDTDTYLDIAVMEKKSAPEFLELYGNPEKVRNSGLSLKVAIEIKYIYSAPDEKKICQIKNDIKGLDKLLKCRKCKRGYFLLYVVEKKKWKRIMKGEPEKIWSIGNFGKLYQMFKEATERCNRLRICCVVGEQKLQCWLSNGKGEWEIVN